MPVSGLGYYPYWQVCLRDCYYCDSGVRSDRFGAAYVRVMSDASWPFISVEGRDQELTREEISMKSEQGLEAFQNVQNQIGFCGIWCGSCAVGNEVLRELTRRYVEFITAYGLEEWGPKDLDYKELLKGLESIENTPLCSGCLRGGGRENCEMKSCAVSKRITGCHRCWEPAACRYSEPLREMRLGAIRAGLFVNIEDVGQEELIETWTSKLRTNWPASILFADY